MPSFKENPIVKKTIERRRKELTSKLSMPSELNNLRVNLMKEYKSFKANYNLHVYEKEILKDHFASGYSVRGLAYDKSFKKLVSENKGIVSDFLKLVRSDSIKKVKDPEGRYLISKSIKTRSSFLKESSCNTVKAYFLLIKDKQNKVHRFYIKEGPTPSYLPSFEEFVGLKLLSKNGVEIISPRLAYFSQNVFKKESISKGHNFICLDYSNLVSLNSFYRSEYNRVNKVISWNEYNSISFKLQEFMVNLKKLFVHEVKLKNNLYDLVPKNVLYNVITKKYYIIDPAFEYNFHENARNTLNLFNKLEL